MTTIGREVATIVPSVAPPSEHAGAPPEDRAVFVTDDDRRSRRLHQALAVAGALALLWLAGLAIGMLGLGGLPNVSLPIPGAGGKDRPAERVRQPAPQPRPLAGDRAASGDSASERRRAVGDRTGAAPTVRRARATRGPAVPPARRGRDQRLPGAITPTPPQPAPVNVTPQPTPQPVRRGLTRRGLVLPPGQERRVTDPQPRPQPETPGQTRRRERAASTTTTTTTTETPGRGDDKPDKQPPPPPPPKG
jgi:hypothetical protein